MHRAILTLVAVLSLAGCGLETPRPAEPRLPVNAFGSNGDEDIAAMNVSSWAFSVASNTHGNPVEAARALAAVDYLADELYANPRWDGMDPVIKYQMVAARNQTRRQMGVPLDAPTQIVVNGLLGAAFALDRNDPTAAELAVGGPAFSLPPAETLHRLYDLPFMSAANIATQNAASESFPDGEGCASCSR